MLEEVCAALAEPLERVDHPGVASVPVEVAQEADQDRHVDGNESYHVEPGVGVVAEGLEDEGRGQQEEDGAGRLDHVWVPIRRK